jgi:hypothetical protein
VFREGLDEFEDSSCPKDTIFRFYPVEALRFRWLADDEHYPTPEACPMPVTQLNC